MRKLHSASLRTTGAVRNCVPRRCWSQTETCWRHLSSVSSRCAMDLNNGVNTELANHINRGRTTGTSELACSSSPHANPSEEQASIKETGCSKSWETRKTRRTRKHCRNYLHQCMVVSSEDITRKQSHAISKVLHTRAAGVDDDPTYTSTGDMCPTELWHEHGRQQAALATTSRRMNSSAVSV